MPSCGLWFAFALQLLFMTELSDFPPIMTAVQAAEFLSVHPEYLRQMVRDGRVPAHKIPGGRGWRFLRDELVEWIRIQPSERSVRKANTEVE